MARKDLLKKAFRNNFLRKSVADLKSLSGDPAPRKPRHASSTNLRSTYEDSAPVLPPPAVSTGDLRAHGKAAIQDDNMTGTGAGDLLAASEAAKASRESVAEWLQAVPKDAAQMSSSEIRREMDKVGGLLPKV